MLKTLYLFIAVSGIIGLYFSVQEIRWQIRIAHSFAAVTATIVDSNSPSDAAKKSGYYTPSISFSYTFQGKSRQSTSIWPYQHNVDQNEASKLLEEFRAGVVTVAYVNPAYPDEAYLLREYSSEPFWWASLSWLAISVGIGLFLGILGSGRKKMKAMPSDHPHWQTLAPVKRLSERRIEAFYLVLACGLPLVWLAIILLQLEIKPDYAAVGLAASVGLLLLAGVLQIARIWLIGKTHADIRLLLTSAPLQRGQPFTLRAQIDAYQEMQLTEFSATLVCSHRILMHLGRRTMVASKVVAQQVLHLSDSEVTTPAGKMLAGAAEATLDQEKWPASGPIGMTTYPYHDYYIRVNLVGKPTFSEIFPVEVL